MNLERLHRMTYRTDVDPADPEYWGSFSDVFPAGVGQIVGVDWSVRGEVTVTRIIPAHHYQKIGPAT